MLRAVKCIVPIIFRTAIQHTWLVATNVRLYNILDDIRKETPNINWSIPKSQLMGSSATVKIGIRTSKMASGLVDFGDRHRNWLYSKDLFEEKSPIESINELIIKSME